MLTAAAAARRSRRSPTRVRPRERRRRPRRAPCRRRVGRPLRPRVRHRHRARRVLVPPGAGVGRSRRRRRRRRACTACCSRRRASSTSTSASLRVGDDAWLDCDPGFGAQLAASLNRFQIRVKADVVDRTDEFGMLVAGRPARRSTSPPVCTRSPTAWGTDLIGPRDALPARRPGRRRRRRSTRGASSRGSRCSRSTSTTRTIPQEAFLELDAVSFTKGCFLGQELVCRIDSRGHVNRFLRRFTDIEGDWPARGAEVVVDGKVVGALTSVAPAELPDRRARLRAPRGRAAGRGRAAVGRRHRPAPRSSSVRQLTAAGNVTTKRRADARRPARRGRRRPSPRASSRTMARPMPGAQRAAGHRARRVEPLEHVGEVGRRDPGTVVVDVELDGRRRWRARRRPRGWSRTSARSRPGWRRSAPAAAASATAGDGLVAVDRELDADLGRRGSERLDRVAARRRRASIGARVRARTGARRGGRGRAGRRRAARAGATPTR